MASAAHVVPAARKASRSTELMRGTVFAPTGASVAWIRDISPAGALVAVDELLPEGSDVIFKRGPVFAAAQVERARDGSAELKFYRRLNDLELSSTLFPLPNRDD